MLKIAQFTKKIDLKILHFKVHMYQQFKVSE